MSGYCKEGENHCVCGGDLPRVREGCGNWVKAPKGLAMTDEQRKAIEWAIGMASQHNIHKSPLCELLANEASKRANVAQGVKLSVWYGPMPESNGKTNWTAILHKGDLAEGHTIDRSEYPDRVRYAADCVRYLIGELPERPWILDYDADKHSGYVANVAQGAETIPKWLWDMHVQTLEPAWEYIQTHQDQFNAVAGDDKNKILVDWFLERVRLQAAAPPAQTALTAAQKWEIAERVHAQCERLKPHATFRSAASQAINDTLDALTAAQSGKGE